MRKLLNRSRPERRPQRLPIPQAELERSCSGPGRKPPGSSDSARTHDPSRPDGSWRVTRASEELADPSQQHVEGRGVHPAVRNDHVGVALARLDELLVARSHRGEVLVDHASQATGPVPSRPARGGG